MLCFFLSSGDASSSDLDGGVTVGVVFAAGIVLVGILVPKV